MADNITYVLLFARDVERDVAQAYVLGEFHIAYREAIVVGRDPSCDVIIDDPRVPARAVEFYARGHHQYARLLPDGEPDRSHRPARVGPYELGLGQSHAPHDRVRPGVVLPVRFGARRNLGAVEIADLPVDPRAAEAQQIAAGLADRSRLIRGLDPGIERWCEERLQIYFAALSWVSTPLRPIALRRIEYASVRGGAIAHWTRAWRAAEARPFRPDTWAQIHRFERWRGQRYATESSDFHYAESFAQRLYEPPAGLTSPREHRELWGTTWGLMITHLATLDDDVSPARPLAALVARGILPLALPDAAVLLCLDGCDEPLLHSSEAGENRFLHVLAGAPDDVATRLVYADYLEDRGELARADALRDTQLATPRMQPVQTMFPGAGNVLLHRAAGELVAGATTDPPPISFEIDGRRRPLVVASSVTYRDGRIELGPRTPHAPVQLISRDDAVWMTCPHAVLSVWINGRQILDQATRPLFDGDVLVFNAREAAMTAIVRAEPEPASAASNPRA